MQHKAPRSYRWPSARTIAEVAGCGALVAVLAWIAWGVPSAQEMAAERRLSPSVARSSSDVTVADRPGSKAAVVSVADGDRGDEVASTTVAPTTEATTTTTNTTTTTVAPDAQLVALVESSPLDAGIEVASKLRSCTRGPEQITIEAVVAHGGPNVHRVAVVIEVIDGNGEVGHSTAAVSGPIRPRESHVVSASVRWPMDVLSLRCQIASTRILAG